MIDKLLLMSINEDYHVHCNYNDHSENDLTVKNVIHRAKAIGLKTLAITEHVRRTSDWVPNYLKEIEILSNDVSVKVIPGFEAKILENGSIDCTEEYSEKYFLIASFHTVYSSKKIWFNALKTAIENPNVDVIGHLAPEPGFILENTEVTELASLLVKNKKIIEINAKYRRPPYDWISHFKKDGVKFHLGSDAHSLDEIGQYERISDLISLINGESFTSN